MRFFPLVLLGLLLLASADSAGISAHTGIECPPLEDPDYYIGPCENTDGATRCGSYCFFARCVDCVDETHRDHGTHRHCSGQGEDRDCERHRDHGSHTYDVSPCIDWTWHLYGGGNSRGDSYASHDLDSILELGSVPEDYAPEYPPCVISWD